MSAAVDPPLNGISLPTLSKEKLDAEYDKIVNIARQVFTGIHPRLKVPDHALKKVPPPVSQNAAQQSLPSLPPASFNSLAAQLPGLQLPALPPNPKPATPKLNGSLNPFATPFSQAKPPSTVPGIDPVLLQKSDGLVRAETQLARQRLERQLKDQFENKRAEARRRPAPQEAKADADLSTALTRALEVAKPPVPQPASPHDQGSASDSFDENSLYSSRAPDSTPEEVARARASPSLKHQVRPIDFRDFDAERFAGRGLILDPQDISSDAFFNLNDRPEYVSTRNGKAMGSSLAGNNAASMNPTAMNVDEDDEPEYSPPEPSEQVPLTVRPEQQIPHEGYEHTRRPLRRYSELDNANRRYGSPADAEMRIVRNQIKSPLAPQPSRLSPLAVAKTSLLSQNQRPREDRARQHNGGPDARSSPEATAQSNNPRKRRKLDRRAAKQANRRNGPNIKEEPVSPPPFHDKQPLGAKMRTLGADRPIYIEDTPVQEVRYLASSDQAVAASPRQPIYEDENMYVRSDPRPISRTALRPLRDEQDLRKVASMQSLRAELPKEYLQQPYETPSRIRAVSHAPVARDMQMLQSRSYQDPAAMYDRESLREERLLRSPAPGYTEATPRRYEPAMMMPPRRRIMIDEYGNEVIYEIVRPARASVAPRPSYVDVDIESSNESAYARNRASPIYVEPAERRYVQEMPPPQISYRRVAESPRMAPPDVRTAVPDQQQDHRRMQRAASVQVADYPTRQPIYVNENGEPSRARMSSVRPSTLRYEQMPPRETMQRVQSARPEIREEGMYGVERSHAARGAEYRMTEAPRYRLFEDDGRY